MIAKRKIEAEELYDAEMDRTSDAYIDAIAERVMEFADEPYVEPEVRLDLSGWVPEGFGTSDCVIVGEGRLIIVDYKHGKGIPVSAVGNPQMRLYALGARALDGGEGADRFDRLLRRRAAECLRLNQTTPTEPMRGGGLYACALLEHIIKEENAHETQMAGTFLF